VCFGVVQAVLGDCQPTELRHHVNPVPGLPRCPRQRLTFIEQYSRALKVAGLGGDDCEVSEGWRPARSERRRFQEERYSTWRVVLLGGER
jgi:hypothetical protein